MKDGYQCLITEYKEKAPLYNICKVVLFHAYLQSLKRLFSFSYPKNVDGPREKGKCHVEEVRVGYVT